MSPKPQVPRASTSSFTGDGLSRVLVAGIRGYQAVLSPAIHALAGPGCGCRFTPTCSQYAIDALIGHGPLTGSSLALRRLMRCHPWGSSGLDPVPARKTSAA